jgi:hypothetical protein
MNSDKSIKSINEYTQRTDLEELTERAVELEERDDDIVYAVKPNPPRFVLSKVCLDAETQIEKSDLFEFDVEVEPILEVLVGKTLHVSLIRLREEQELEGLARREKEFEALRAVELAELQRLEADIKRRALERKRREEQEQGQREAQKKVAADSTGRVAASEAIADLEERAFAELEGRGRFDNPTLGEVRGKAMEQVLHQAGKRSKCYEAAAAVAGELLEAVLVRAEAFGEQVMDLRKKLREQMAREALEKIVREEKERQAKLAEEEAKRLAEEGGGPTEGEIE